MPSSSERDTLAALERAARRLFGSTASVDVYRVQEEADPGPRHTALVTHAFGPAMPDRAKGLAQMGPMLAMRLRSRASHDLALAEQLDALGGGTEPLADEPHVAQDLRGQEFDGLVRAERARQDRQWGSGEGVDIRVWVLVLAEEAGEAVKALNHVEEGKGTAREAVAELVQTAAVCRRIYEVCPALEEVNDEVTRG